MASKRVRTAKHVMIIFNVIYAVGVLYFLLHTYGKHEGEK